MVKFTVAGLVLLLTLSCGGVAEASGCTDENGNPVPCEQDPGGGGSGGDPCSVSQAGWCDSMTIYPAGLPCDSAWCQADPSSPLNCATYNTPTCPMGTDGSGNPVFEMINNCAYCG